eukprot:NODE_245_length_2609_cov_21.550766_g228_i0.p1 GENE.NODE_245_length_2609_cov_21.550766_g228_i0~~NODE_245_length_2609_cov_21.550766_g228_i0.p1  ORF type:complete len:827 (-),score=230.85 NODE_245_length_2609_cov_21.550766_g228_i0:61-2541(-)
MEALLSGEQEVLLIGEGDFSFACSVAYQRGTAIGMVCTTLDSAIEMREKYPDAPSNTEQIRRMGGDVCYRFNATHDFSLDSNLSRRFDAVVWNFPLAGDPTDTNTHLDLLFVFLDQIAALLKPESGSRVYLTLPVHPPYSTWNIAKLIGNNPKRLFKLTARVPFDFLLFPGYTYCTNHQADPAEFAAMTHVLEWSQLPMDVFKPLSHEGFQQRNPNKLLFVANLPTPEFFTGTEAEVRSQLEMQLALDFSEHRIHLVSIQALERRGLGILEFTTAVAALQCLQKMHGFVSPLKRTLVLSIAGSDHRLRPIKPLPQILIPPPPLKPVVPPAPLRLVYTSAHGKLCPRGRDCQMPKCKLPHPSGRALKDPPKPISMQPASRLQFSPTLTPMGGVPITEGQSTCTVCFEPFEKALEGGVWCYTDTQQDTHTGIITHQHCYEQFQSSKPELQRQREAKGCLAETVFPPFAPILEALVKEDSIADALACHEALLLDVLTAPLSDPLPVLRTLLATPDVIRLLPPVLRADQELLCVLGDVDGIEPVLKELVRKHDELQEERMEKHRLQIEQQQQLRQRAAPMDPETHPGTHTETHTAMEMDPTNNDEPGFNDFDDPPADEPLPLPKERRFNTYQLLEKLQKQGVEKAVELVKQNCTKTLEDARERACFLAGLTRKKWARVSLLCPMSQKQIKDPAKGCHCLHLQTFDLTSFLRTKDATCPVQGCGQLHSRVRDLYVDTYTQQLLAATPDPHHTDIKIMETGDWKPLSSTPTITPTKRLVPKKRPRMGATLHSPITLDASVDEAMVIEDLAEERLRRRNTPHAETEEIIEIDA